MLSPSSHREKWQNWQNLVLSLFFIMSPYNDCGQVFSAIFFAQYSDITLFSTVLSFFFLSEDTSESLVKIWSLKVMEISVLILVSSLPQVPMLLVLEPHFVKP